MSNRNQATSTAILVSLATAKSPKSPTDETAPFSPMDETARACVESYSPDYSYMTKGEVDDRGLRHDADKVTMEVFPKNYHFQCIQFWFLKRGAFGRMSLGCLWLSTDVNSEVNRSDCAKLAKHMQRLCTQHIESGHYSPAELAGGEFNKLRNMMLTQTESLTLRTFKSEVHPRSVIHSV